EVFPSKVLEQIGKETGEQAIARARHNRAQKGASEPALDLLEKFLKSATNITPEQRDRWAGDYPLTVLEEATKRISQRFGASSARELADTYPSLKQHQPALDAMLRDIGMKELGFDKIRNATIDFAESYGIPGLSPPKAPSGGAPSGGAPSGGAPSGGAPSGGAPGTAAPTGPPTPGSTKPAAPKPSKVKAVGITDPKAVMRALKDFAPVGKNREKVVTLLDEARRLTLSKHPHSFCFLLRSMFEISAKAYCSDHSAVLGGPKALKADGSERHLVEILKDVTGHLTSNGSDMEKKKVLHGAMAELAKPSGFLSVTSMNQLVHNPKFSVTDQHISALFSHVFPLLEAMNA
ncbi:hypothetical protein, partial [Nitrospira sp. BLG_2]|uniref:hypothetical protein n=1 Tax=Nitrospira sp. BLG_2 TaxID=3397507 RepID=UPI003B9A0F99